MRANTFRVTIFLIISLLAGQSMQAQKDEPFTCFNAQEIKFPLSENDFEKSQILMNDTKLNALYYLYQDKYTFWYKFIATEDVRIEFSVSPSNMDDRYRAVAFQYDGKGFCDKLVNKGVKPLNLKREALFTENSILYKNIIEAAKGDTFYISVLSLNSEDCGHYLYMEANNEQLSLHAIHRPCYNFQYLDVPDFSSSRQDLQDVDLELELSELTTADSAAVEPDVFAAITTVEVQSQEEGVLNVGDKLVLNQVFFYSNTYALKPGSEEELNQLLAFLEVNESISIEIQGHTANDTELIVPDPQFKKQGKAWNFKGSALKLSELRAKAVQDYLIEGGIDKKRLTAKGFGASQKRVANASTFEESEKNMRVEALIIKQ
jgi:outer membrane protein OmpA-like peptidoglycan-associated protein